MVKRLRSIEAKKLKWERAYEADAITIPELKEHKERLDSERQVIETELERVRNREEELARLDEEEARARESIETTGNNLEEATPEKRRELYQDLRLRVEVGEDKRSHISGVFPARIAGVTGTLLKTPDQRGYFFSREDAGRKRGVR